MPPTPEKKFKLRQVLFVYFPSEQKIIPLIVVKATTEQTLGGEHTKYELSLGLDAGVQSIVTMEQLLAREVIVFDNLGQAKQHLVETTTKAIEEIISSAAKSAREMYKFEPAVPQVAEAARAVTPTLRDHGPAETVHAVAASSAAQELPEPPEEGLWQLPDGTWARPKISFNMTN